jgi:hypothetical protein
MTATGVKCIGVTIKNGAVSGVNMALGEGQLEFTGVTVDEPAPCQTPETNKTKKIVANLEMDETVTAKTFVKAEPATAGGNLTNVVLEECPEEGVYPVKGIQYGEATNATAVQAVTQEAAANATTIAMSSLKLGPSAATFEGEIAFALAGSNSGKSWGAENK